MKTAAQITGTLTALIAVAALIVSPVSAATEYGEPDGWMTYATQQGGTSVSPDDRPFSRATIDVGIQPAGQVGISPDSRNVSIRPQLEQQAALQSATVTTRSPGGFDWTDALIGAAAAFAALALAGLALTAIRRMQPHPRGRLA